MYIDLRQLHEVNHPQAFDGQRAADRTVRRTDLTMGTEDHNTPTVAVDKVIQVPSARAPVALTRANCAEFGIPLYPLGDPRQGTTHVIAPGPGRPRRGRGTAAPPRRVPGARPGGCTARATWR